MGSTGAFVDNNSDLGRHDSSGAKGGTQIDSDGSLERAKGPNEFTSSGRSYRTGWAKKLVDVFFAKRQLSR